MTAGQIPPQPLLLRQFICREDNYGYLLHDPVTHTTAAIDSPSADAILDALDAAGWRLDYVLNTHHHGDHVDGNLELKARTGCRIAGARADAARIPGIDILLDDGERFVLGTHAATVIATPGHTQGHLVYHFEADRMAFVGDTLFAMGCGRLFEGTAQEMWQSLQALLALPGDTRLYCGHEYTRKNARFALGVDAANVDLIRRSTEVDGLCARGESTMPTTVALERRTNPFLRAADPALAAAVGLPGAPATEVFAELRRRRNAF